MILTLHIYWIHIASIVIITVTFSCCTWKNRNCERLSVPSKTTQNSGRHLNTTYVWLQNSTFETVFLFIVLLPPKDNVTRNLCHNSSSKWQWGVQYRPDCKDRLIYSCWIKVLKLKFRINVSKVYTVLALTGAGIQL